MRKSYSSLFKLKAANIVLDQGLSAPEVCASLDIGLTSLRRWDDQMYKERLGSNR